MSAKYLVPRRDSVPVSGSNNEIPRKTHPKYVFWGQKYKVRGETKIFGGGLSGFRKKRKDLASSVSLGKLPNQSMFTYCLALSARIEIPIRRAFFLFFSFRPEHSLAQTWYLINIHCPMQISFLPLFFQGNYVNCIRFTVLFLHCTLLRLQSGRHHRLPHQEFLVSYDFINGGTYVIIQPHIW